MPTVVGVRLRFTKTLWFDPAGTDPAVGETVVVTTERGTELGTVVQPVHEVPEDELVAPLKPVLRIATDEDRATAAELAEKEREALKEFRRLIDKHHLDMKPVDVEYLLDGSKIVFYFSAEERVDFRELVRELASIFRARIDMRQVGVRDEARVLGGIGHCGQLLCCVRFGGEFQPVSIRMAKEQDLPLNPLKISGLCGRLMCCLRYEYDAYKDFKSRAPKRGAVIETPVGEGKVEELNTPRETVRIRLADGTALTVPLEKLECAKGTGCPCSLSKAAFDEVTSRSLIVQLAEAAEASGPEPAAQPEQGSDGRRRRRRSSQRSAVPAQPGGAGESEQPAAAPERSGPAAQEAPPQQRSARRRRRRR